MDELISIDTCIDIDAAPEAVRRYLVDPRHAGSWLAGVTATERGFRVRCLDREFELCGRVEDDRLLRTATFTATQPFDVAVAVAALPHAGACRVRFRLTAAPGDYFGLPEPVVELVARRRFAADLVALRELATALPSPQRGEGLGRGPALTSPARASL